MVQSSASVETVLLNSVVSREWGCFDDISPSAPVSTSISDDHAIFIPMVLFISEMCIATEDQKIWNKGFFFFINVHQCYQFCSQNVICLNIFNLKILYK